MFAATVEYGYEYHDDYITLGTASVTISGDDIYSFGTAEQAIHEFVFETLTDGYDGWAKLDSIERVA